jgi:FkbM family methyltransferase
MTIATLPAGTPALPLELLRSKAMQSAAAGRQDEARGHLKAALAAHPQARAEVLSDLAAIELRRGDLPAAIAVAREVLASKPEHDAASFTLAVALAAIGSQLEAWQLFDALTHGARGARFQRDEPELAALATTEAARLRPVGNAAAPAAGARHDLSQLAQAAPQNAPAQDDEAQMLFATIRVMRLRRVLEIGGQAGYSARNFLRALSWGDNTAVYSVDAGSSASQAPNHYVVGTDPSSLVVADVHHEPVDLVFFNGHAYEPQMNLFVRLANEGIINDDTVIALHGTALHAQTAPGAYPIRDANGQCGFVQHSAERAMVNELRKQFGYDAFCGHAHVRRAGDKPQQHGLTLMKRFFELRTDMAPASAAKGPASQLPAQALSNRPANPFVATASAQADVMPPDLPVHLSEQYGQCGEDLIVASLLRAFAMRKGLDLSKEKFLEIGGNHPIATSASYLLARSLGMTGVIVEANPRLIADLRRVRTDAKVIHAAVNVGGGATATLTVSNQNELSSLDRRFVTEWHNGSVGERERVEVPAIGINQLLASHFGDRTPLYLSVDIEGLDVDVLQDMDFTKYRPAIVQAEPSDHHLPNNSRHMVDLLESRGYVLVAKTSVNQIFVDATVY